MMNGRRTRTTVLVIVLVVGLGTSIGLAFAYSGGVRSFTVVANPGNEAASPLAMVISKLVFVALTAFVITTAGWLCFRFLRGGRHRNDS